MSRTTTRRASSRIASTAAVGTPAPAAPLSKDSALAGEIKALVVAGRRDAARERFADLVALQQRRAARIAYQYLRDVHDADEAVQDAFVKVYTHIASYREDLPFEVWFTRILVNGCLDLRKARSRRLRWVLPATTSNETTPREPVAPEASPEQKVLASERGRQIAVAVAQLPERQRDVFTLCQMGGQSATEVSKALGLSEATVRVHLFRAIRRLRGLLERERK
jgi:RNA polymerase sigma-70 factor (ECF subfamily)